MYHTMYHSRHKVQGKYYNNQWLMPMHSQPSCSPRQDKGLGVGRCFVLQQVASKR